MSIICMGFDWLNIDAEEKVGCPNGCGLLVILKKRIPIQKTWTLEMEALYKATRPPEEPPCDCQKCERRHGDCAEFTALNHPEMPYNRGYCHWFKPESINPNGSRFQEEE